MSASRERVSEDSVFSAGPVGVDPLRARRTKAMGTSEQNVSAAKKSLGPLV